MAPPPKSTKNSSEDGTEEWRATADQVHGALSDMVREKADMKIQLQTQQEQWQVEQQRQHQQWQAQIQIQMQTQMQDYLSRLFQQQSLTIEKTMEAIEKRIEANEQKMVELVTADRRKANDKPDAATSFGDSQHGVNGDSSPFSTSSSSVLTHSIFPSFHTLTWIHILPLHPLFLCKFFRFAPNNPIIKSYSIILYSCLTSMLYQNKAFFQIGHCP